MVNFAQLNFFESNSRRMRNINSILMSVFMFQYGLFIPFSLVFGGQYMTVFFTFIFVFYAVIYHQIRFNISILLLILIPTFTLFLKFPFEYNVLEIDVLLEMLVSFLTIGLSGILLGTLRIDFRVFAKYCYIVAWLNFCLIFYVPFTQIYGDSINYMRLGYALTPIVLVSLYSFLDGGGIRALILFSLSFLELILFGARGSLLTVILFSVLYFFFVSHASRFNKVIFILFSSVFFFVFSVLLSDVVDFYYLLDIDSYLVNKLLYLFDGKTIAESSSGRDEIWAAAMDRIFENPLFGSPINSSFVDTGSSYYHNIFLDILVKFGVFGFLLSVLIISFVFLKAFGMGEKVHKFTLLFLFVVPFGRLLVSSSFWQRPEFWLLISFCITMIYYFKSENSC